MVIIYQEWGLVWNFIRYNLMHCKSRLTSFGRGNLHTVCTIFVIISCHITISTWSLTSYDKQPRAWGSRHHREDHWAANPTSFTKSVTSYDTLRDFLGACYIYLERTPWDVITIEEYVQDVRAWNGDNIMTVICTVTFALDFDIRCVFYSLKFCRDIALACLPAVNVEFPTFIYRT